MRVALISYHTSPLARLGSSSAGGMNVYVRRLAEGLADCGVEVDVFTRRDSAGSPLELEFTPGARLVTVRAGPDRVLPKSDLAAHTPHFAAALTDYVSSRDISYDVIHSHYWLSGVAAQSLRRSAEPIVHMFHTLGRVKRMYQPDAGQADAPSRDYAELSLLRSSHTLVFSTDAEVDDVERVYRFRPASVALIPPGVDRERFSPIDRHQARALLNLSADKVVLFVGRMDRAKGVDALLRAAARLRTARDQHRVKLVVVGGDDDHRDSVAARELARLRTIVHELELDEIVEFRGVVPQESLPMYYAASDVCAVPSRYESFGMVALEALSAGRPVVGFRSRGLEQTVRSGQTGFLVPSGDVDGLAQALDQILSDHVVARAMGLAARESVKRFSWEHVVEQTLSLYSTLLSVSPEVVAAGCR